MTERELGTTGARVSSLCMGCWEIGGLSWGPMASLDAVALVRAAFDAGITTFDTAEQYGGGRSETVLGKALEGVRGETVLVTKVGYLPGSDGAQDLHLDFEPQDFSPARIQQACELSLRRLRTSYIDALLLHDPPLQIVRQPEPFEALRRLQQAGKIRWWGVSASPLAAAEAIRLWDAPVVESPFHLADDSVARHVLPLAAERGTGVLARSPFGSGILMLDEAGIDRLPVTDWRRRQTFRDRVRELTGLRARLNAMADARDEPVHETAIRYVLGHEAVSCSIVGISSELDIQRNAPAGDPPHLSAKEIAELEGG